MLVLALELYNFIRIEVNFHCVKYAFHLSQFSTLNSLTLSSMAFWGIEVKEGSPFILYPFNVKPRLHISQATLGAGFGNLRNVLKCQVGKKTPIFLCSLIPYKAECCQLNLEFEETEKVIFSVIGSRSVHISGYYLPILSPFHPIDDALDHYSEDIAETESRSEDSDDEYGGSFIDDDDELQDFSFSSDDVANSTEELLDMMKFMDGKRKGRQLRKKYRLSDSESDVAAEHNQELAIYEDGNLQNDLLASIQQGIEDGGNLNKKMGELVEEKTLKVDVSKEREGQKDGSTLDVMNKVLVGKGETEKQANCKDGTLQNDLLASIEVGIEDGGYLNRMRGEHVDDKTLKVDVSKEGKGLKNGSTLDVINEVVAEKRETEMQVNAKDNLQNNCFPASTQVGIEDRGKLNGKMEERVEEKMLKDDGMKDNKGWEDGSNVDAINQDVHVEGGETQKKANGNQFNLQQDHSLASNLMGFEDASKQKRKREEQVEEKTIEGYVAEEDGGKKNGSNMDIITQEVHVDDEGAWEQENSKRRKEKSAMAIETNKSAMDIDSKNANDNSIPLVYTMTIEELEMGKQDGQRASLGNKVHILYTRKLILESGQEHDLDAVKVSSKFQLGGEGVDKVWNVGLGGMQVGGKRKFRFTLPTAMCYSSSEGSSDTIVLPPNAGAVLEVELRKVK